MLRAKFGGSPEFLSYVPPRCAASWPQFVEQIWNRQIDPGRVFDLELPLEQAAEGHRAMDERRAIKVLLRP